MFFFFYVLLFSVALYVHSVELDKTKHTQKKQTRKMKVKKMASLPQTVDNRQSFQSKRARQLSGEAIWTYYMHFGQSMLWLGGSSLIGF
jgi:hypothetical protein